MRTRREVRKRTKRRPVRKMMRTRRDVMKSSYIGSIIMVMKGRLR